MGLYDYLEQQADEARTEERINRRTRFSEPDFGYYNRIRMEYNQRVDDIYFEEVESERSGCS